MTGAKMGDFRDALELDGKTVGNILQELKKSGIIRCDGHSRSARWFIVSSN